MFKLTISFLELKDLSEACRVLSLAMLKNPLHVAILQGHGKDQQREIQRMFEDLFHSHPGIVFLAKRNGQIEGVMRMKSCLGSESSADKVNGVDPMDKATRVSLWQNTWNQHDPNKTHWHLGPIGVLPSAQGLGVGTAMMTRFCQEVDACRSAAYLETDLDYNVRFYKKFGFDVIGQADLLGVRNSFMWRSAGE